jgi:hypothetical protein
MMPVRSHEIALPDYATTLLRNRSPGVSDVSRALDQLVRELNEPSPTFRGVTTRTGTGLKEQLYDARAAFKVQTAQIAMHLDMCVRSKLFRQLDSLLDYENWEPEDAPPTLASYLTFLRMLLDLKPTARPALGATSDERLVAAWTEGDDRLTIECLPNDEVRWVLSRNIDGDRESAAGITKASRLKHVLAP